MIAGFSAYNGISFTRYDEAPETASTFYDIEEIGHTFALEDYIANGPAKPGFDLVRVTEKP